MDLSTWPALLSAIDLDADHSLADDVEVPQLPPVHVGSARLQPKIPPLIQQLHHNSSTSSTSPHPKLLNLSAVTFTQLRCWRSLVALRKDLTETIQVKLSTEMHWAYSHQMPSNHLNDWSHHPKPSTLAPVFTVSISKAAARPGNLEREKSENCFKVDTHTNRILCQATRLPQFPFPSLLRLERFNCSMDSVAKMKTDWRLLTWEGQCGLFIWRVATGATKEIPTASDSTWEGDRDLQKKDSTVVQCTVSSCWYSHCHWANCWYSTWVW